MPERLYVSAAGQAFDIIPDADGPHRDRDAHGYYFRLLEGGKTVERICVLLVLPRELPGALERAGITLPEVVGLPLPFRLLLQQLDGLPGYPQDKHGNRLVELMPQEVVEALQLGPISNRELRRFIARRLYHHFAEHVLNDPTQIDAFDLAACRAQVRDILRNAQLLEQEGYLTVGSSSNLSVTLTAKSPLIREVERHGAVKADVIEERDFLGAIDAYHRLAPFREQIREEYTRYSRAMTATELVSVFRGIAPVVEALLKDLLQAHGSTTRHATLGPAIADLQRRTLGTPTLPSQLNHILKFGRDLTQHGAILPQPVLRIATENAFELIPQLAALYPRA